MRQAANSNPLEGRNFHIALALEYFEEGLLAYAHNTPFDPTWPTSKQTGWNEAKKLEIERD